MPVRFALLGLLCLIASTASGEPNVLPFPGVCDASAAIAVDDKTIIVADDESSFLSTYDLENPELPKKSPIPLAGGEFDLEGAVVLAGRIVWISSYGRSKDGEAKDGRFQLFASHRIDQARGRLEEAFSPSFTGLRSLITSSPDPQYGPLAVAVGVKPEDPDLAPKERGFNVEGVTVRGEDLLIGLRNPQVGTKAILFELRGFQGFLDGRPNELKLGKVISLDLGGRGVRDIAWSQAHNAYLIIAGPRKDDDEHPDFALYRWNGDDHAKPALIDNFADFKPTDHFHPEAVVPLLERSGTEFIFSRKALVLSDDGTRPMSDGKDCNRKHRPDSERQFRGVVRLIE